MGKWQAEARRLYPNRTAALTAIEAVSASARCPSTQGLLEEDKLANQTKATVEAQVRSTCSSPNARPARLRGCRRRAAGTIASGRRGRRGHDGRRHRHRVRECGDSGDAAGRDQAGLEQGLASRGRDLRKHGQARAHRCGGEGATHGVDQGNAASTPTSPSSDVLIEAVFESMDLKKKVFARNGRRGKARRVARDQYLDAGRGRDRGLVKRPEDVIGLHFFSPANVMPLARSGARQGESRPRRSARRWSWRKLLRKTPVLARVCYGFIGNRMMEGLCARGAAADARR